MICAYSLFCYLVWFLVLFALVKIMAFFKGKLVDSIARNLGDPKGIIGFLVMVGVILVLGLRRSIRILIIHDQNGYLGNKPILAAGISADNVRG